MQRWGLGGAIQDFSTLGGSAWSGGVDTPAPKHRPVTTRHIPGSMPSAPEDQWPHVSTVASIGGVDQIDYLGGVLGPQMGEGLWREGPWREPGSLETPRGSVWFWDSVSPSVKPGDWGRWPRHPSRSRLCVQLRCVWGKQTQTGCRWAGPPKAGLAVASLPFVPSVHTSTHSFTQEALPSPSLAPHHGRRVSFARICWGTAWTGRRWAPPDGGCVQGLGRARLLVSALPRPGCGTWAGLTLGLLVCNRASGRPGRTMPTHTLA